MTADPKTGEPVPPASPGLQTRETNPERWCPYCAGDVPFRLAHLTFDGWICWGRDEIVPNTQAID